MLSRSREFLVFSSAYVSVFSHQKSTVSRQVPDRETLSAAYHPVQMFYDLQKSPKTTVPPIPLRSKGVRFAILQAHEVFRSHIPRNMFKITTQIVENLDRISVETVILKVNQNREVFQLKTDNQVITLSLLREKRNYIDSTVRRKSGCSKILLENLGLLNFHHSGFEGSDGIRFKIVYRVDRDCELKEDSAWEVVDDETPLKGIGLGKLVLPVWWTAEGKQ